MELPPETQEPLVIEPLPEEEFELTPTSFPDEESEVQESPTETPENSFFSGLKIFLREVLEVLLPALALTLLINMVTGRYQVQSVSMEPTLHEGQYLLASKISYLFHGPQRGDIIVLDPPNHQSTIPYIKRVIGLPGDHIDIHDGRVWVNNIPLNEPYISGPPTYIGNWIVGPDEFFVLGDNRNNSSDSHHWGMLPRANILGKAIFRYWPFEKLGPLQHYTYPELEENNATSNQQN